MMLDLESVQLFVLAAEYGNLTRASEAPATVQPVVSQRIKALEDRLGRKLLDHVRLTDSGASFRGHAKTSLAVHDAALMEERGLGISDHTLGTSLQEVLRSLRRALPARTSITVRLGRSHEMRDLYDRGEVDIARLLLCVAGQCLSWASPKEIAGRGGSDNFRGRITYRRVHRLIEPFRVASRSRPNHRTGE